MRAAARRRAVRSERCGDTTTSKPSARRRRNVRTKPRGPRSRPRLSSIRTWSTSGCPANRDRASGRTSTARRRGWSRRRRAVTSGVVNTTSPRKLVCTTRSAGPARVTQAGGSPPCSPKPPRVTPAAGAPPGSLEPLGLIDQHDRNVVLDRVAQLAGATDESVLGRRQRDLPLALGAGQDFQQILAYRHRCFSLFLERPVAHLRVVAPGPGGRRGASAAFT